ncbi:MAG: T9SS type A sorting domain-containing protein [Bacteroidales bacterium]|nr:T9SS type A sorting domain-containing protein [Bacteroidales bacterium]
MKKTTILFYLLLLSIGVFAQTEVSGNQSGTWTAENSPYLVTGHIMVPSGEVLNIEAGVEVNFQGYYKFTVEGNLQALGNINDSIFFTTDNPIFGWGGIRLDGANGINNLSFCRIEFGKTAGEYPDIHGGGMAILSSSFVISDCVFADNDATGEDNGMGGAIYGINTGSPSQIINTNFIRNHAYGEGGAIKFTSDIGTEIIDCKFLENDCLYGGGAISLYSVFGTKMIYCLFVDNYTMYSNGGAIHSLGMGNEFSFENCTITNNTAVTGDGGGVYLAYANANFINSIIYDNPGMYSDGIFLDIGSSADINYCNTMMPEGGNGSNNINENPQFVDEFNGNYQLDAASPCIDAGTDIGYEYYGDAPDMGRYEYGLPTATYQVSSNEIAVYPNPTKHIIHIMGGEALLNITLYDIKGSLIKEMNSGFQNQNNTIDVSDLKSGIYFVNIQSADKTSTFKVIKH